MAEQNKTVLQSDTSKITTANLQGEDKETNYYDSLANAKVDITTLEGKREYVRNHFIIEYPMCGIDDDTLLDLNYDGCLDYIIEYHGQAGTGIKNRIKMYLYDQKQNEYRLDEQISALLNPTFYIKQKKITWFYIGLGTGEGGRLEWKGDHWVTTKEFQVVNKEDKTVWEIYYPLNKKKEKRIKPFQMIPPDDILETRI